MSLQQTTENYSFPSIICVDCDYLNPDHFTLCITNNKNVITVGKFYNSSVETYEIFQINELINIKMISCGGHHSICLDYDGNIFSFGSNDTGQLGIGKTKEEFKFSQIPQKLNIPSCKQICCGPSFSMCLTEDGLLYSFGDNEFGNLALGNNENYNSPQLIPDFYNIQYINCSGFHSICKTYNDEFYSWGCNLFGQLGQGDNYSDKFYNKPILCNNWPDNIISISSGWSHSLLLTSEGQLYSFGNNNYGQLGINDENIQSINIPTFIKDIPEIQRIECGKFHSMCIDINNNLWLFGNNESGQLGLGHTEILYKPILHPTLLNIIDISSGGDHTFVKTFNNEIYAFGKNKYSQLGIETSAKYQLTPIQVFIDNEDIWCSTIGKSRAKSARK